MYSQDRDSMREMFFRAWRHHKEQRPLEGVERMIVGVALRHPEYQRLLETPDAQAQKNYLPELGESNPFLHMGLHIAIEEQLALDRPAGVRALYQKLLQTLGDTHVVEHTLMDCLAETLWRAQRDGRPPDEQAYLQSLERIARAGGGSHL